ncbi:MAG TPA: hypothetical protein VJ731_10525 [Terriglobales bacterium]|nr:hypothetical protein [Terriglobales bacterium]
MIRFWILGGFLLLCSARARSDEILDRTVATVNGHVVLLSDLEDELRVECLLQNHAITQITQEDRKAALDRLTDQELLREQMRTAELKPIPAEAVQEQVNTIKEDAVRVRAGKSWETILSEHGVSEKLVEKHVADELQELRFIDARFRPSVQVSPEEIQEYYKDELVPKLPVSDPVSLAEIAPKIREILVQKKIDQMLETWLQELRTQATIRILQSSDGAPSQSGTR